jgi:spoIIIJ-associated protein
MQTVEITGKSVDEAKRAAADKLGVSPENVNVTVLEETKGLFGKSTVRIRAEVAKSAPAPKGKKAAAAPTEAAVADVPEQPMEAIQEAFEEPAAPPTRGRRAAKAEPAPAPAPEPEPAPEPVAAKPARGRKEKPAEEKPAETAEAPGATDADAEQLVGLVREILDAASFSVNVRSTQVSGRYVNIELDGKDVAYLVVKHGEVLYAMQYLVNISAGRRFDNGIRATLDGNNYRDRREQQLYQHAVRVAEEVKKRGEEAVLDALPAFERRIVHKALAEYGGVTTYSEGEEPNRRVVIAPAE